MTETPGQPGDPTPEQRSNEPAEPTPAATSEPTTEPMPAATSEPTEPPPAATSEPTEPTPAATGAPTAGVPGESPSGWWPKNRRNQILTSAAVAGAAVAVVAASFTSGFVVGTHTGTAGQHQARSGQHSVMSAYPEHARTGQIWIIPGDETASGQGLIVVRPG